MKSAALARIIPGVTVALCAFLLVFWFSSNRRAARFIERVPGQDQRVAGLEQPSSPKTSAPTTASPAPGTGPSALPFAPTSQSLAPPPAIPGEWPRFRGAGFDNVSSESISLAAKWSSGAPPMLWAMDVGEGYAGAAVSNSRAYILDYDRQGQADVLRCLALADGRELWRYAYPCEVKRNHGMSRTVPAVSGQYVVTIGPKCNVLCANSQTGKPYWMIDLVKDYRTEVPAWYAGQCPLIDNGRAIIAPGGTALMIAVDCATGKVIWKTPNPNGWAMTHSSIVPMTFQGRRMYVYCGSGGVAGISAKDGAILWQTPDWTVKIANVPSPVLVGGDRIFLSGGYNAGSAMLQLKMQGGKIVPQMLFKLPPDVFGSDQQTPICYKGYIYGVIPGGQMACIDLNGKQKWTSGSQYRFGLGPYIVADGKIIVMNDQGVITIADANPAGFKPLAQFRALTGQDCWGPMALADGRLIARDLTRMVCLDIAKR